MHIELKQPEEQLFSIVQAGEHLHGQVHLNVTKTFPAHGLFLFFEGKQDSKGIKSGKSDKYAICALETKLASFLEGKANPGHYTYPFKLYIPDWLP